MKPAAVYVNLAGGEQTALNTTAPVTVKIRVTVLMESVNASRASQEKTAQLRSALWTVDHMVGVWVVFAFAQMATLEKNALKPSASTTA